MNTKIKKIGRGINKMLPLLILGLGAFLRLFLLGEVPGGLHQDETFVAWNAFALWKEGMDSSGSVWPVYLADWGDGHSALYSWILIPIYMLVGEQNINYYVTRLPQALIGIITLWIVYLLLKKMFNRETGLWGLFLLAICPWHITMCRWGLDANLAPGFLIFGLYSFILALDNRKFLLLTAIMYGLSLYTYAVIWPIVPVMILLQSIYGLYHKKLKIDKWAIISTIVLAFLALPLLLFVYVNAVGKPIELPFMTIPVMDGYRASEMELSLPVMWSKIRKVITLLWRQNIGAVHDILLPYGLFYDIGRVFIIIGFFALMINMCRKVFKKVFCYEVFIFIQLFGALIVCSLVNVNLHQVNCLFIPLVLLEVYGVVSVIGICRRFKNVIGKVVTGVLVCVFTICLIRFQNDYYGDYRKLLSSYYVEGMEDAVQFAMQEGDEIVVERGAQWPRILFFSRTLPSKYLEKVQIRINTEPSQFSDGENMFYITIDYNNIDTNKVHIFYFPDKALFENDFELTQFNEWYVAVPK